MARQIEVRRGERRVGVVVVVDDQVAVSLGGGLEVDGAGGRPGASGAGAGAAVGLEPGFDGRRVGEAARSRHIVHGDAAAPAAQAAAAAVGADRPGAGHGADVQVDGAAGARRVPAAAGGRRAGVDGAVDDRRAGPPEVDPDDAAARTGNARKGRAGRARFVRVRDAAVCRVGGVPQAVDAAAAAVARSRVVRGADPVDVDVADAAKLAGGAAADVAFAVGGQARPRRQAQRRGVDPERIFDGRGRRFLDDARAVGERQCAAQIDCGRALRHARRQDRAVVERQGGGVDRVDGEGAVFQGQSSRCRERHGGEFAACRVDRAGSEIQEFDGGGADDLAGITEAVGGATGEVAVLDEDLARRLKAAVVGDLEVVEDEHDLEGVTGGAGGRHVARCRDRVGHLRVDPVHGVVGHRRRRVLPGVGVDVVPDQVPRIGAQLAEGGPEG